ncbi:S8 family serine peptidase [Singulisphaera sp. Ch08]|uniref:S8 family serine peptidase n=1 Tax=Singulisphaera sp. Ch08 TaxID=3120278 RepID=A0AAU7CQK9_9BACT
MFNLSIGSGLPADFENGGRQSRWAEDLDTLARELQVLIVLAAGNHKLDEAADSDEAERVIQSYPEFLFHEGASLSDPATAAIAVTVGGIAEHEAPEQWEGEDHTESIDRPVARRHEPTPSTRIGPGINESFKPDFVEHGGNSALRGAGVLNHEISSSFGYGVLSFSANPLRVLFASDVGTSFAAPKVARTAAMIWHRLKEMLAADPHPNLIRALMANSANVPQPTRDLITSRKGEKFVRRVCGYGVPDLDLAMHSGNRRVTLIASSEIKVDDFYIYQVPITEEFLASPGKKRIIVSLAFDPPVRRRRAKYLGVAMQTALYRGVSVEHIIAANKPIPAEEKDNPVTAIQGAQKCDLKPSSTELATSTLHRSEWTMSRRQEYGDTYYLVVRALRTWAPASITHQNFGLAVTLVADHEQLYNSIRQRVQVRARARGRQ